MPLQSLSAPKDTKDKRRTRPLLYSGSVRRFLAPAMKLIKCIIQPHKLHDVVEKLQSIVTGMTVFEVRGFGRQKGHSLAYRGVEYNESLLPKAMIDIVTDDNRVDDVIKLVIETARTGCNQKCESVSRREETVAARADRGVLAVLAFGLDKSVRIL